MLRGRIARGVAANVVDRIVIATMQLAVVPVQATHWGAGLYGLWTVIAAIPALLAFSDFGFATAAGTRMAMSVAGGDRASAARTFASAGIATLAIATVLIAIGATTIWCLPNGVLPTGDGFSDGASRTTLTLLLIYSMLCLQNSVSFAGFRCDGYLHVGVASHSATYLAENSAMIAAIVLGAGPAGAAAALLVTRATAMMIQRVTLGHLLPWLRVGVRSTSLAEVGALFRPANSVMAVLGAQTLILQGCALAIGAALSPAAVPVFTTVRTLTRLVLAVTALFGGAAQPEFSAAAARGDVARRAQLVAVAIATSLVVCVPLVVALAVAGPTIVATWTHGVVHPPYPLVWSLCASVLLASLWQPLSTFLVAINEQGRFAYAYLAVAAITVALTFGLCRQIGATGAGVAMLAADATMLFLVGRFMPLLGIDRTDLRDAVFALASRLPSRPRT